MQSLSRFLMLTVMTLVPFSAFSVPVQFSDNGHYYEYVSSGGISWYDAADAANAATYDPDGTGNLPTLAGYLVTITSAEESAFVFNLVGSANGGHYWLGLSDEEEEGVWQWVTGPESGSVASYEDWHSSEPNGSENENFAHGYNQARNTWNDISATTAFVGGYVIEYSEAIIFDVPVPPSLPLVAFGLLGLLWTRRRS